MFKYILVISIFLTFALFSLKQSTVLNEPNRFQLPIIYQESANEKIKLFTASEISESSMKFYGKYKFVDTMFLNAKYSYDTNWIKDLTKPTENINTDGFQIFTDYTSTINHNTYQEEVKAFFPVYLVNETTRTKLFIGKDSKVFGVQEVLDSETSQWVPIEYKGFDFCGNGYFGMKIHPGEFALLLVPKYSGNEKNLMRVRINIGETIYISQPFVGKYNRSQTSTSKDSWISNITRNYPLSNSGQFYGAIPKWVY